MKRHPTERSTKFGPRIVRGRPPHNKGLIRERYDICPDCGQAVDLREVGETRHHDAQGHKPLTTQ